MSSEVLIKLLSQVSAMQIMLLLVVLIRLRRSCCFLKIEQIF